MSNAVPDGWERKLLKDTVSAVISGQSPNRKDHAAKAGKYGILKTTAIDWGKYSPDKNQEVLDDFKVNPKHEVKTGDILITKAGPVHRVGVVTYVPETPKKMLVSGKMTLLRTSSLHDSRFVSYALATEYSQKPLKESTTGMALSQTNFTHETLLEVPLWVPDALLEQQKIAAILSSVDDVIEKTRAQIDKLKDLKTGMMQELLTKGIGSGGVPHTEFKDSPVGQIPASWTVKPLGDLADKISDGIHTTPKYTDKSGYRFVNGNNLKNGHIYVGESAKYVPESEYLKHGKQLTPNTILMSINGTIGNLAYYRGEKVVLGKSAAYISLKGDQSKEFVYFVLQSQSVKTFYDFELTGSTINNLSLRSVKETPIPVPPPSEQEKIANILTDIDDELNLKNHKVSHLNSLKKALMQDLLTGKVRVKVDQKESAVA